MVKKIHGYFPEPEYIMNPPAEIAEGYALKEMFFGLKFSHR